MAETQHGSYLSIGEVLGLLLEEFPDVTISKIRFLESQGLISPERTPSGYRKFYDEDVDLLRVILTEQRQNFLPLRVIKDRLETGEIDPTGEHLRPPDVDDDPPVPEQPADVPTASVAAHPAGGGKTPAELLDTTAAEADDTPAAPQTAPPPPPTSPTPPPAPPPPATDPAPSAPPQLLPGVLLDRTELCAMVGITDDQLSQLESYGVIHADDNGGVPMYDDSAVEIAKPASAFLRAGVDARHLRNFRTAAEREALLYEQLVTPRFRQRNPEARAEALSQLRELDDLGAQLRAAMTRQALGHHFRG